MAFKKVAPVGEGTKVPALIKQHAENAKNIVKLKYSNADLEYAIVKSLAMSGDYHLLKLNWSKVNRLED